MSLATARMASPASGAKGAGGLSGLCHCPSPSASLLLHLTLAITCAA
eukprot:CAMPEP_0171082098 /NCGR_PEP_ID=MMETSP0766_2-20121228/16898_1 /TAXON_ID=439317 /ORGANISM="Gambierdiscus australes, Strain CAWD 149" /LENGTH=46 /DNA_ID= /DNA_START= /DNA_END= /DNA_ORIENTATION=